MKPRIPERNRDLRRYVLRHRLLRIAGYLLWLAAFWGGAMVYNQSHQTYTPDRLITGWKLGVWMLAAVLIGFFLFRIGQMLFDRPFTGVIVRSSLSHTYTPSDDPGTLRSMTYDFRLNTRLIVRTDAGKKRRLRFEQKPGFYKPPPPWPTGATVSRSGCCSLPRSPGWRRPPCCASSWRWGSLWAAPSPGRKMRRRARTLPPFPTV